MNGRGWTREDFYEALPRLRQEVAPVSPERDLQLLEEYYPRRIVMGRSPVGFTLEIQLPESGVGLKWEAETRERVIFQAASWAREQMGIRTRGASAGVGALSLPEQIVQAAAEGRPDVAEKLTAEWIRSNL
jgi:hypothetical protein